MESLPCVIVVDYQRLTIRLGCGKRAFGTGVMTKKDFHEGLAWIDKVLEDDRSVHKKQRHMAHRIFERLRAEEGFSGGYAIVREYVARATLRAGEMFVPLSHRPGHAQADFGQADAYFAGKKVRFHYFCMDLPHSDGCFVKAYPAETAEAFARAMWRRSIFSAACRCQFCTTTPGLRWPGS